MRVGNERVELGERPLPPREICGQDAVAGPEWVCRLLVRHEETPLVDRPDLRPADRCAPNDNPLPSGGVHSDAEPATRASRVLDDVEIDLAIRGAACFADCPEAIEHRGGDHEVRDEQLGTLGSSCRASLAACRTVGRGRDLRVDLTKGAVEADAVTPADELDVAVDLVVAAANELSL